MHSSHNLDQDFEMIHQLLKYNHKVAFYASGCCSSLTGWLGLYPGSSKILIEARNLTSRGSIQAVIGKKPEKYVDPSVSILLAKNAYLNAQKSLYLQEGSLTNIRPNDIIGIGITGALKTLEPKKGNHRAYLSIIDSKNILTYHIHLDKEKRSREEEDIFLSENVLNTVMNRDRGEPTLIGKTFPDDKITRLETTDTYSYFFPMLNQDIRNIIFLPNGEQLVDIVLENCAVLPGSFNPIHKGHIGLAHKVMNDLSLKSDQIIFELSVLNADKGVISEEEIQKRIKEINSLGHIAMISMKPLYCLKNSFLRNGYFILGADTYQRLINVKYYKNSRDQMLADLLGFVNHNNKLLVAPRLDPINGNLLKLEELEVPNILQGFVESVTFREDISSTEIREKLRQQANHEK